MAYESSIIVGGSRIVIDKPMRDFMAVYARLCEGIIVARIKLKEKFRREIKSYEYLFPEGFDMYMNSLSMFCEDYPVPSVLRALFKDKNEGKKVTNELLSICIRENILPGVYTWAQAYNEIEVIREKFEQYKIDKAFRPDTYGNFRGGGYGIRGALTGALKASLLNLAVDTVAGVANQAIDHSRLGNIGNELNGLYNKLVQNDLYLKLFEEDCHVIRNMLLGVLIKNGYLPNIEGYEDDTPFDTLKEIFNSSKIDIEHYDKAISDIGDRIQKKPYEPLLYITLCEINPKRESEIYDFIKKNKMEWAYILTRYRNTLPKPEQYDQQNLILD